MRKMKLYVFIPITYKSISEPSFEPGETFTAQRSVSGKGIKFIRSESNVAYYSFVDPLNDRYLSIRGEIYKTYHNTDALTINAVDFREFGLLEEGSVWRAVEIDSGIAMFRELYLDANQVEPYITYLVSHLNDNRATEEEGYMLGKMVRFNGGDFKDVGHKLEVRFFTKGEGLSGLTSLYIAGRQEKESFKYGYYSLEPTTDFTVPITAKGTLKNYVELGAICTEAAISNFTEATSEIEKLKITVEEFKNTMNNKNKGKEKKTMNFNLNNIMKDVQFGKAGSNFALTFDGQIAFMGKSYDAKTKSLIDSGGLVLDMEGLIYIMPQPTIAAGDVVVKNNIAFYYDGTNFINMGTGEKTEYVPTRIFNMTFYSVVKNLAQNMFAGANSCGMSNMLPLLLLQDKGNNNDNLMLMMMMSQGGFNLFGAPANNTNNHNK
jgi:hypothetical protein